MSISIALDISTVTPQRTGIGTVTAELAARLPFVSPEHEFLYVFHSFRQPLPRFPLLARRKVTMLRRRIPGPLLLSGWHWADFPPVEILAPRAALWHAPGMFIPPSRHVPIVATIHDLFFLDAPHAAEKSRWGDSYFSKTLPRRLRHVSHIIVPSSLSAHQLRRHFGPYLAHLSEHVHVIPWGVGPRYFLRRFASDRIVLQRFGLEPPYLLTIGGNVPRKNMGTLLEAHRLLGAEYGLNMPLICVGATPPHRAGLHSSGACVYRLPYVSRHELGIIMRNAAVYVSASLMEGFGLPQLEAMAAGVPVVSTAECGVFEFTGQGSACLVSDVSALSLAAALARVLTDDALRVQFATKGREAAARLTWRRTAMETLAVYEKTLKD